MLPPVVIRPILLASNSVNHRAPSGPTAIPSSWICLGGGVDPGKGNCRMRPARGVGVGVGAIVGVGVAGVDRADDWLAHPATSVVTSSRTAKCRRVPSIEAAHARRERSSSSIAGAPLPDHLRRASGTMERRRRSRSATKTPG